MTPIIRSPKAVAIAKAEAVASATARCIASQIGASRTWQNAFDEGMRKAGFVYNPNGPCFPNMDDCEFGHHPGCGWEAA